MHAFNAWYIGQKKFIETFQNCEVKHWAMGGWCFLTE